MLRLDRLIQPNRLLVCCLLMLPIYTAAANDDGVVPETGLFLFLSKEEQMAAEKLQASTAVEEAATAEKDSGRLNEKDAGESVTTPRTVLPAADKQAVITDEVLYNGAVLMGNEVLGLWINKAQILGSNCLRVEDIDRYGVVRLSSLSGTVELRPGHKLSKSGKMALMIEDAEKQCE